MAVYITLLLLGLFAQGSLGGNLTLIDYSGHCLVWSGDNYGCTGSSDSFALINGTDCSGLSKRVNGTEVAMSTLNVGICGTEEGHAVAWIKLEKSGYITFSNKDGAQAGCNLDHGFEIGSACTVSDTIKSPAVSATSTLKTSSTVTVLPSSTITVLPSPSTSIAETTTSTVSTTSDTSSVTALSVTSSVLSTCDVALS